MTAAFYKSCNISVLVWVPYALFLKNLEIKAANRFAKRGIPDNSCLNALKHNCLLLNKVVNREQCSQRQGQQMKVPRRTDHVDVTRLH